MSFKTYFNWSSGKDSALALYYLTQDSDYTVDLLLTSFSEEFNRVTMHGTPDCLVVKQANAIGIPLKKIIIPKEPSIEDYNSLMRKTISTLKKENYTHAAFGDIFLEDLKKYREDQLQKVNLKTVFPLWKRDTKELMTEFINLGFKAKIVCVNNDLLPLDFLGEDISVDLIKALPKEVDPCGENGEFHTFCYDGPLFNNRIDFTVGEKIIRQYSDPTNPNREIRFGFCDLINQDFQGSAQVKRL